MSPLWLHPNDSGTTPYQCEPLYGNQNQTHGNKLCLTCCEHAVGHLVPAVMKILALKTTAMYEVFRVQVSHRNAYRCCNYFNAFHSNTEADTGYQNETVRSSQRGCWQVPGLMGGYVLSTGEELPVQRTSVVTAIQASNLAVTKRRPASVWK
jgi:hypothetical protein